MTDAKGGVEMSESTAVLVEVRDHVMVITLNRPEKLNALDIPMMISIGEAMDRAEADVDIRVVVITGAGDRAFTAGMDMKAASDGNMDFMADPRMARWGMLGYVQHPSPKPTIAAVNGLALGAGTEIVLASDMVVAAETASFGLPEVTRGLYAGAGGAFRFPRQIPQKIGTELVLTGRRLEAKRAYELGLVNHLVPQAEVLPRALELAAEIAANAPLSVQASVRIARGREDDAEHWARNDAEGEAIMTAEDVQEGMLAFIEKRQPNWKGR